MKKYLVDIDGKTANVEVVAEHIDMEGNRIVFIRDREVVASFSVWRYWKCEGNMLENTTKL